MIQDVNSYRAVYAPDLESNPLEWWRNHERTYPCVAELAKSYLAVSATSVPSKQVFSTTGDIVSASRFALTAENVHKLIFLAKSMKIDDDDNDDE